MLISLFRVHGAVSSWHIADNPVAPAFVRFWTKADIDQRCHAWIPFADLQMMGETTQKLLEITKC